MTAKKGHSKVPTVGVRTDRVLQLTEPVKRPFPKFEEYDESGACMMPYRAFPYDWSGRQTQAPSLDVCWADNASRGMLRLCRLEQNGATDLQAREVYSGSEMNRTNAVTAARNLRQIS
ncbi:hypothetical protein N7510_007849 [Penicillium lagena]|uniref:uncharacterized protein n=1 Tax=Penicillium lagena TaxID=94218 RepID=UPI00253F976A|nr:uncharacterized protein N7510_007849 [Penicillium lagena]KAJ5611130.1 hypothetical protein N7510_007849 [Penicillium lagena]